MGILNQYAGQSTRAPSPKLWGKVDKSISAAPGRWVHVFQDFTEFPTVAAGAEATIYGGWKGFASTGGAATVADIVGGGLTLGSDGDDEGVSIGMIHYPFQISRSHGKLVFEARIKTSTIADSKHGFFLGLIDSSTLSATVPIAAAGTLADENFVGFHRLEGDGDKADFVYKANGVTQVTQLADAATLVADTFTKLGFVFEPADDALTAFSLRCYQDGVELPQTTTYSVPSAAGTDFPNDVRLGAVLAILNATGTSPGDSTIDWIRIAQEL